MRTLLVKDEREVGCRKCVPELLPPDALCTLLGTVGLVIKDGREQGMLGFGTLPDPGDRTALVNCSHRMARAVVGVSCSLPLPLWEMRMFQIPRLQGEESWSLVRPLSSLIVLH